MAACTSRKPVARSWADLAGAWSAWPRGAVSCAARAPHAARANRGLHPHLVRRARARAAQALSRCYALHAAAGAAPCILATSFFYELFRRRDRRAIIAAVVVAAAAIPALCDIGADQWRRAGSARGGASNPRRYGLRASPWIATPTTTPRVNFSATRWLRPTADTADIVVTANLVYDRFRSYAARKDWVSRPTGSYYRRLNALPHLDVSNGRPTLGVFQPCAQDRGARGQYRAACSESRRPSTAAAPEFKVRLIERRPKT